MTEIRSALERPVSVGPLDREQARLLELLRGADGPVSFAELHERGVGNPAMLAYELEAAGVPVRHVERLRFGHQATPIGVEIEPSWFEDLAGAPPRAVGFGARMGRRVRAAGRRIRPLVAAALAGLGAHSVELREHGLARLAWARERGASAMAAVRERAGPRAAEALARARSLSEDMSARSGPLLAAGREALAEWTRPLRRRAAGLGAVAPQVRGGRWWVLAAAVLALGALIAGLIGGASGSHAAHSVGYAHRAGAPSGPSATPRVRGASPARGAALRHRDGSTAQVGAVSASSGGAGPSGAGSREAAALAAEGHRLLEEGRYAAAIATLRAAIAATGQSAAGCAEPRTQACLTYAYSLYDLGRALRLDHRPQAAQGVLSERLRIDNQRPVVEHQLAAARRRPPPVRSGPSVGRVHRAAGHTGSPTTVPGHHRRPAPEGGSSNTTSTSQSTQSSTSTEAQTKTTGGEAAGQATGPPSGGTSGG